MPWWFRLFIKFQYWTYGKCIGFLLWIKPRLEAQGKDITELSDTVKLVESEQNKLGALLFIDTLRKVGATQAKGHAAKGTIS
jgi:hypothetical protein